MRIINLHIYKALWAVVAALAVLCAANDAMAVSKATIIKSHMDKHVNPYGCAGCHSGVGKLGTPMLRDTVDKVCLSCHGSKDRSKATADIESTLRRSSYHPIIKTSVYHKFGEVLPEEKSTAARHVTCVDCHIVHESSEDAPTRGAAGYKPYIRGLGKGSRPVGKRKPVADYGYELCYECHSDSANLPSDSRNIATEFNPDNASYHPVEAAGKGTREPSLVSTLRETDTITCTDCHGSDDKYGPKGPHGSDASPLLVGTYKTEDGPESERSYELCYMCHDRKSIIGDKSFRRHNYHIVTKKTSCYTCHASHGTQKYERLISFNPEVVKASVNSSGPYYYSSNTGWPKCYLYCHNVDHWSGGIGNRAWP